MSVGSEQRSEPAIRAPWPVVALVALIIGGYGLQALIAARHWAPQDWAETAFGFTPADLASGRWSGLITAMFVHGGWAHALMNSFGALAFGAPVARAFGRAPLGTALFLGYYLACGVVASLGFALVHPRASIVLIGASGAVSGLMGAASRLIEREGQAAPLTSRTVLGMAFGWIVVNLLMAVFGNPTGPGAPVAWEAHLFGYAAGVSTIGWVVRLRRPAVPKSAERGRD